MNPEFTFYLITACSSLSLPRFFFFVPFEMENSGHKLSVMVRLSPGVGGGGPGSPHSQQVQQSGGAHSGECRTQIVGFLGPVTSCLI